MKWRPLIDFIAEPNYRIRAEPILRIKFWLPKPIKDHGGYIVKGQFNIYTNKWSVQETILVIPCRQ